MDVRDAIRAVVAGHDLPQGEAFAVASAMIAGSLTPAQLGALLAALRAKGETADEIHGFAAAVREHMTPVGIDGDGAIDTCGTGGDGAGTFNISTVAAFVAAGAGCRVAKHGNRAVSSRCGSADLLEHLGVPLNMTPEQAARSIRQVGIGFLFAPCFHPSLKHAAAVRREIGVRTMLNIVGPLANPARTKRQLIGVFDASLTRPLAETFLRLGADHCLVVHGHGGLDEISLSGPTQVTEARRCPSAEGAAADWRVQTFAVTPEQFGFDRCGVEELRVADMESNVKTAVGVLQNRPGPARDIVALNAGAAIYVAGAADSLEAGVERAFESIASGRAHQKLEQLRQAVGATA